MKKINETTQIKPLSGYTLLVKEKTMKNLILVALALIIILPSFSFTREGATVWVASPWQRVLRNTPPGEMKVVKLKAASNEYEPFRLIIHADTRALKEVNVTVSSLKIKNGKGEISAGNIQLFRANYLNITKPSNRGKNPVGWYPDALIPFMEPLSGNRAENVTYVAAPFSVDTEQNAEVWCDVFIPPGTKPGIYLGTATVSSGKKTIAKVPIELKVWDFELPEKIAMLSHFGGMNKAAARMMGIEVGSQEFKTIEDLYDKELLKHRAMPSTPSGIWPEWNEKDGIIENGETERIKHLVEVDHVRALDITSFRNRYKEDPEKCRAYLAATAEWLNKLGYLDMAYVYLEDEPNNAEQYELVRKQGALVKSANPGIARLCTEEIVPTDDKWGNLYGAVDIWCPHWSEWHDTVAKERLALGEKIWSYTALCQGPEETPWWEIDMEPINYRSPMWISWQFNITGCLYWSSVHWNGSKTLQGVWEAPIFRVRSGASHWGEGMLLYPGQPAGIQGFVPSIRLKLYREAAEDYEYMTLAAKNGRSDKVNQIVNGVATSFQAWSRDQGAYEQARERIAELIQGKK